MATQTVKFRSHTGIAQTLYLFAPDRAADAAAIDSATAVEDAVSKGVYRAAFIDRVGDFEIIAMGGSNVLAMGYVTMEAETGEYEARGTREKVVTAGDVMTSTETILESLDGGACSGVGAFTILLTVKLGTGEVVPDCDVVLTSTNTASSIDVVASSRTGVSGQVVFYLDSGTYYGWRQKAGYNFTNPSVLVVDAEGGYSIT